MFNEPYDPVRRLRDHTGLLKKLVRCLDPICLEFPFDLRPAKIAGERHDIGVKQGDRGGGEEADAGLERNAGRWREVCGDEKTVIGAEWAITHDQQRDSSFACEMMDRASQYKPARSEGNTSELQSLMRLSYADFC